MKKRGRKSKILVFVMSLIMIFTCTNTSLFAFAEDGNADTNTATVVEDVNSAEGTSGDDATSGDDDQSQDTEATPQALRVGGNAVAGYGMDQQQNAGSDSGTAYHIDIGVKLNAEANIGGTGITQEIQLTKTDVQSDSFIITAKKDGNNYSEFSVNKNNITKSTGESGVDQYRIAGSYPTGTKGSPVYYTVTFTKTVQFTDDYSAPIKFTKTFTYWDSENDCPGIKTRSNGAPTGFWTEAGLDFTLGTGAKNMGVVTIEKKVVDEEGTLINDVDKSYTFNIKDSNGNVEENVSINPKTESSVSTNLNYGTYYIEEDVPDGDTINGKTYSGTEIDYIVIGDDGNKSSEGSVSGKSTSDKKLDLSSDNPSIRFIVTNTYSSPTTVALQATKVLENKTLAADQFTFQVIDGNEGDSKDETIRTATNTANGEINFGAIEYTEPGTYSYTIKEAIPEGADKAKGITYDNHTVEVEVVVTDNDGKLSASVTYDGKTDIPTFTNKYSPEKTTVALQATKVLENKTLAADQFTFQVIDGNEGDSKDEAIRTATNTANGEINFGAIEYTEPGTYSYTIKEAIPEGADKAKGITYDNHTVEVEVVVTDNDGKLSASVTYDGKTDIPTFTNKYSPEKTTVALQVVKHVIDTKGDGYLINGTFYVALFSDDQLTNKVSEVKELSFDGSKTTAIVDFLVTAGEEYYVAETDAKGKPLSGAQPFGEGEDGTYYNICFGNPKDYDSVFDYPESAVIEIPESGLVDDVEFSNIFDSEKYMITGSITIDKEVKIGKDIKPVDGSFYVTAEYSQQYSDTIEKQIVELKVENGNTKQPVTISNLPTDTEITLKETDAKGDALKNSIYNPIFTYGGETGETLTVRLTEEASDIDVNLVNSEKLIDVAFDLKWDDYDNRDETRGDYAVTLFANGKKVEDSTKSFKPDVTEGETCKWTDLPMYDEGGKKISYTVKQTDVPKYYTFNTDGLDAGLPPDEKDGIVHLVDTYRAIELTKEVTDSTGNAMKYNGNFYVTLFADPECKKIADIAINPVKISLNDESSKTVVIPVYNNSVYYLAETDANGNKVDSSFKFISTFSSTIAKVTDDEEVSITLTNQAKSATPTDNPNKDNDDSGNNITDDNVKDSDTPDDDEAKDSDVQTGDSTNIMLLLAMMITSIMLGIIILLRARRKEIK